MDFHVMDQVEVVHKWGWLDGPVADWAGPTPKNKGTTFLIS